MNTIRLHRSIYNILEGPARREWTEVEVDYQFDWIMPSKTKPGRLSGMATNQGHTEPPDDEMRENKGTWLKSGKFLRALGYADIDRLAQRISNELRAMVLETDSVEITDRIAETYTMRARIPEGNCMQGMGEDYFNLYHDLDAKIARIVENDQLMARALIWENVMIDGKKACLMDRIYSANHDYLQIMKKYARENGYHHKTFQSYSDKRELTTPRGHEIVSYMEVDARSIREFYDRVPYVDTFSYYDERRCFHNTHMEPYTATLGSTAGRGGILTAQYICDSCGNRVTDPAASDNYIEICDDCYDDYTRCCECDILTLIDETVDAQTYRGYTNVYCSVECMESDGFSECTECGENRETMDEGKCLECLGPEQMLEITSTTTLDEIPDRAILETLRRMMGDNQITFDEIHSHPTTKRVARVNQSRMRDVDGLTDKAMDAISLIVIRDLVLEQEQAELMASERLEELESV